MKTQGVAGRNRRKILSENEFYISFVNLQQEEMK